MKLIKQVKKPTSLKVLKIKGKICRYRPYEILCNSTLASLIRQFKKTWIRNIFILSSTAQDSIDGTLEDEVTDERNEPSCFESILERCLPTRIRKHLPTIILILATLWGVSSDTALAIIDVGTDYKVAVDYLR